MYVCKGRNVLPVIQSDRTFFLIELVCSQHWLYCEETGINFRMGNPHAGYINSLLILVYYGFSTQYSQQTLTWIQSCRAVTHILSADLLVSYKFFQIPALLFLQR